MSEPDTPLTADQRQIAGIFGSYGSCDVPRLTVENVLNEIKTRAQPDYLFWTGDSTAHDDPWVNQQEVNESLTAIISLVQETFPESESNLFVALGNHDSFPNGMWDFNRINPAPEVRDLL